MYKGYLMNLGLEVHVELKTKSKIFCSCPTEYGAEPNTHVCPVCMGFPGTLPVLNEKVLEYAIMAGLATDCEINQNSKMDRKNYFYPDLPKAYQISQYDVPLCINGHLDIETEKGEKTIRILRIHMEEDAGKLMHNEEQGTMIDCNRCGVPLIEIVTEPDFESAQEVDVFLNKLRRIILDIGISDCKMNEGSFRADVNLSVRKSEQSALGTRTEMKNLNSFAFIQKAIEYEYMRQVDSLLENKKIIQETRRYDEKTKKTFSMRTKEDADDYRYFPDPDLVPINLTTEYVDSIKSSLPILASKKKPQMMKKYDLSSYDCENLTKNMVIAELFEQAAVYTDAYKMLANLIVSKSDDAMKIKPLRWAKIASLVDKEEINISSAKKLMDMLLENDFELEEEIKARCMYQINDISILRQFAITAIGANPKAAQSFRKGNALAIGPIVGHVMKLTKGYGNPALIKDIVTRLLEELSEDKSLFKD